MRYDWKNRDIKKVLSPSLVLFILFLIPSHSESFNLFDLLKNPDKRSDKNSVFVTKVIDGDTIILSNGEKVRYLGIDAPETHKKDGDRWIEVSEPFGNEATTLNRNLVENKEVTLRYDIEKKDHYGRTLAYVYVNNAMVNTALLSQGLAFPYDISNLKNYSMFKLAFFNAIKAKRGLYKNVFLDTKLFQQIGLSGWYRAKINSIYHGDDKTVIKTDYLDIHINKKNKSRTYGLKQGNICYFYGKLIRKKERYILLSDNPHHIVVE